MKESILKDEISKSLKHPKNKKTFYKKLITRHIKV